MAIHPQVEVRVHRCFEFENEVCNSHFPDPGGGMPTRAVSPVMSFPNSKWFIKLMDGSEIPIRFCPYCGESLICPYCDGEDLNG